MSISNGRDLRAVITIGDYLFFSVAAYCQIFWFLFRYFSHSRVPNRVAGAGQREDAAGLPYERAIPQVSWSRLKNREKIGRILAKIERAGAL